MISELDIDGRFLSFYAYGRGYDSAAVCIFGQVIRAGLFYSYGYKCVGGNDPH